MRESTRIRRREVPSPSLHRRVFGLLDQQQRLFSLWSASLSSMSSSLSAFLPFTDKLLGVVPRGKSGCRIWIFLEERCNERNTIRFHTHLLSFFWILTATQKDKWLHPLRFFWWICLDDRSFWRVQRSVWGRNQTEGDLLLGKSEFPYAALQSV